MTHEKRGSFGSKLGIILATAGSAVGLGNIWRFPYMTGQNGGAIFILVYLLCVLFLGLPCMLNEFIIGRHAQTNTARAYGIISGRKAWKLVGYLGVLTGFMIASYYAVVSGWCLQYIVASGIGELKGDSAYVQQYFTSFISHPIKPVFWTVFILFLSHLIIMRGIQNGVEKASKLMMPTLFILLVILVVVACLLPNAWRGIAFMFHPDFSKLSGDVLLSAMGQAFYSLSIGMGCLCTYASYFSKQTNLVKSAVQVSVIDTFVAILAGLIIFPTAFSVGVNPDSGPSLIFITLPNVFNEAFRQVPIVGYLVGVAFYVLLSVAALTSLISIHEVSTAFVHEEFKINRKTASRWVTLICAFIGVFCSLSMTGWESLQIAGKSLFDWFDFITSNILLPTGGLLTSVLVGWVLPKTLIRSEYTNNGTLRSTSFAWYWACVKFVCPVCIALIFLHQLGIL